MAFLYMTAKQYTYVEKNGMINVKIEFVKGKLKYLVRAKVSRKIAIRWLRRVS